MILLKTLHLAQNIDPVFSLTTLSWYVKMYSVETVYEILFSICTSDLLPAFIHLYKMSFNSNGNLFTENT